MYAAFADRNTMVMTHSKDATVAAVKEANDRESLPRLRERFSAESDEAVRRAIGYGNDTDTTAAVTGGAAAAAGGGFVASAVTVKVAVIAAATVVVVGVASIAAHIQFATENAAHPDHGPFAGRTPLLYWVGRGRYRRYMEFLEQCRSELAGSGQAPTRGLNPANTKELRVREKDAGESRPVRKPIREFPAVINSDGRKAFRVCA